MLLTSETIVNTGNLNLNSFHIADNGNTIYYAVNNSFYQKIQILSTKKKGIIQLRQFMLEMKIYMGEYLK
jgi:hypothetical protein